MTSNNNPQEIIEALNHENRALRDIIGNQGMLIHFLKSAIVHHEEGALIAQSQFKKYYKLFRKFLKQRGYTQADIEEFKNEMKIIKSKYFLN